MVSGHPTFLVLDKDENLLSRAVGASSLENEFIASIVALADPSNFIENKKSDFENGRISPADYFVYSDNAGLEHESSRALEALYRQYVTKDSLDVFAQNYLGFFALVNFDKVNSSLYEFLCDSTNVVYVDSTMKQRFQTLSRTTVSNSVKYMLLDSGELDSLEYEEVGREVAKLNDKSMGIMYSSIIGVRENGLTVMYDKVLTDFEALNKRSLFDFIYYFYRHPDLVEHSESAKAFLQKITDTSNGKEKARMQSLYDGIYNK